MLISKVPDEAAPSRDHSHEYQTASELFDMMARNHPFEPDGTKLMSNAEELKRIRPNQHVETVVYNDDIDSEDSDVSEIYGNEDMRNVFSVNSERIDLFNDRPPYQNTLCQKLGDLEIQASNLSMEYDQHFLFKDPYIKEQLKNLNGMDGECDGMVLPTSLLDYIFCKRLEDNYNFYMENIIRYVKHTIEQLKRISNGDYLTDKAKEKWREVENASKGDDDTKVLATSTSIPLQVERKLNGVSTTWDDIIHSEVDVRSLSKILEKKIIVEVPKLICGSYKLFSKFCSDNLIISCKREKEPIATEKKKESRVDVVLQLERSDSGHVMSNISSIMILQATPIQLDERPKPLPLSYNEKDEECSNTEIEELSSVNEHRKDEVKKVKIVEVQDTTDDADINAVGDNDTALKNNEVEMLADENIDDGNDYTNDSKSSAMESGDSSIALRDILDTRAIPNILRKEAPYNFISPDDLSLSMHKLNLSSLPEENSEDTSQNQPTKKKSPMKVRIKSPYENKSFIMEEKKRKKLLEIRDKREKKKMAGGENCKVSKHRYGKGIMPSSSVTNLSITNKSFYNSIYGQNVNFDNKSTKSKGRRGKRELFIDAPLEQLRGENESPMLTPDKNNKKYVNRSYYLDEAVTEMMYTQLRQSDCSSVREIFSASASAVSAEFPTNRAEADPSDKLAPSFREDSESDDENKDAFNDNPGKKDSRTIMITSSRSILNVVPANSPKNNKVNDEDEEETSENPVPTVACRKSIEKLYDLMKKLGKTDTLEMRSSRSKLLTNISKVDAIVQGTSTIQGSDSGTSLKHHLTSSNPSSFSFEKINNHDEIPDSKITSNKNTDALTTVVPKVIISTKHQTVKAEVEKVRKERKKIVMNPLSKVPDNPLKAISQLLHEFDSVQKTRQRLPSDSKPSRKSDSSHEGRNVPRQGFMVKRRSRIDQSARENEIQSDKNFKVIARDRRARPTPAMELLKIPHQQIPIEEKHVDRNVKEEIHNPHNDRVAKEDKHLDRFSKKKIADIIDEVKEAKGEAVRGPSKMNSRLNSLAQPKKSYVQAHSEEYQTRYGRNLMADRLQRLASAPPALVAEKPALLNIKNKPRRTGTEAVSSVSVRPPPPPQAIERGLRLRRSASSSPEPRAPAPPPAPRPGLAFDAPDNMKNKMVAVESYVKSHFRRSSPHALGVHKARVPLVPTDLDLSSVASSPTAEESTAIGSRLHSIIDSMIHAAPAPLSALRESRESSSRDPDEPDAYSLENLSRHASSVDSDYRADIFKDKNVETAVESFQDKRDLTPEEESKSSETKYDRESNVSSGELQKLEDALHGRVSVGSFRQLRMNDFALTPKRSLQRALVVRSGDVVLKSSISKSLKLSSSRSDVSADLNTLPALGNSQLGWNFRSNIPMQIATVGYAFPDYHAAYCEPNTAIKSLDNIFKLGISLSSSSTKNKKSDKTSQCFKGSQSKCDTQDNTASSLNTADAMPVMRMKQMSIASVSTEARLFNNIEKTCGDCSIVVPEKRQTEVEKVKTKSNAESIDCTSSLDMLVGLLNEIQKITTGHITDTVQYADEQDCKELEDVINGNDAMKDTAKNIDSHELVSIASLDKMRQLESSPSIYSLYLSDGDKESIEEKIGIPRLTTSLKSVLRHEIPIHVDKEVGADFPVREYTSTFTDVPSTFFPITITHSTNVTNSLIGILSKPSSQTMFSLEDYESACADSTFNCKKIMEITEESKTTQICETPVIAYPDSEKRVETFTEQQVEVYSDVVIENVAIMEVHKAKTEMNLFSNCTNYHKSSDFDPLMKMKRDLLVTIYSMLVLTVFAALSFPELVYHV
ncbi:uncharacterized protein LOC114360533 isoform X2 [Ostrinia furnacalis]|uniref:uncharacterized protein LOC114360533 isoform X2 n=1 Tax=Ostrinia furnacalis TaxID=93504 RepID=UPI00103F4B4F|nr:uncharacterized protein LOC114360533 isoform X2 [Ostrinia furnacalis]